MNAVEFKAVLDKLADAVSGSAGLTMTHDWKAPLAALNEVWLELTKHRLEMEEAERREPIADGPEARLDAIEKRLGEIVRSCLLSPGQRVECGK